MTYVQLLLIFVVMPTLALSALVLLDRRRTLGDGARAALWPKLVTLLVLMGVATLYTIPWDDHLISSGVWWYKPTLLAGAYIDHIPIEEVLFFPLQTLLIGVWWMWLTRSRLPASDAMEIRGADDRRTVALRVAVVALGIALWFGALTVLRSGWHPGTYLGWEIVWALPPLLLQILAGGGILWRQRLLVSLVVVPATLYLSCVDALAIHLHIWTIDPHQSLDVLIGGQLPVEELLFFLVTSVLVSFGLVLGVRSETWSQARALLDGWRARVINRA